ncbi:MAG TPA: hypothetical protein VEI97_18785 [bacterium]|nr:hypothetical protein [bacterium]
MITQEMARERVARGAALLDEQAPGWAEKVNVGWLDMSYATRCVLGQLYGNYDAGMAVLFPVLGRFVFTRAWKGQAYGFFLYGPKYGAVTEANYRALQEAWVEAIADRVCAPLSDEAVEAVLGALAQEDITWKALEEQW